jgi:Putative  PD-(D/E)XK family member, (DUF4420)
MTITERDWGQLESDWHDHGVTFRRLYPQSPHEVFIGVRHPDGARMLTIALSTHAATQVLRQVCELPHTRGLEMQFAKLDNDRRELRVILTDASMREVFNPLASDIAQIAHAQSDDVEAVLAAVERFNNWRQMLEKLAESGLSAQARRGLVGELSFLRDFLLDAMPATAAVRSWTGPSGAHQDFQFARTAVEIKTSSGKEPQTIVISSERELDDTGVNWLVLAHFSLDERRGGSGESLNAIVDRIRDTVSDAAARDTLNDLLIRVGYLEQQRGLYEEPRYTMRKKRFWSVTDEFPRITESDLRPGVGDCRYRISTIGLDAYLLTGEDVVATVKGAGTHE